MDLLDKVLLEWSAKTDKGYPDLNSKQDLAIFESMFGFKLNEQSNDGVEHSKEDIKQLIDSVNLDSDELSTLYRRIQTFQAYKPLKNHLEKKGFDEVLRKKYTKELQNILEELNPKESSELIDYINPESNRLVSFPAGKSHSSSFTKLLSKTGLSQNIINAVNQHSSVDKGKLGVGMGELGLTLLFDNIVNADTKGDLAILSGNAKEELEIKGQSAKLGDAPSSHDKEVYDLLKDYGYEVKGAKYFLNNTKYAKKDFTKLLASLIKSLEPQDRSKVINGFQNILSTSVGLPIQDVAIDYTNSKSIQDGISSANFIRYAKKEGFNHFLVHDYGTKGRNTGKYVYVSGSPAEMAKSLLNLGATYQDVYPNLFKPRIGIATSSNEN